MPMKHYSNSTSRGIPFLKVRTRIIASAWSLLLLGVLSAYTIEVGLTWWMIIPILLAIALIAYSFKTADYAFEALSRINATLVKANAGDFSTRITSVAGLGDVGKVAWGLNDLLDRVESYFKEVDACFSYVSEGRYDRKALYKGMPGRLRKSLSQINKSLKSAAKSTIRLKP